MPTRLPAARVGSAASGGILPDAGGRLRSHDAATGLAVPTTALIRARLGAEDEVTSNVGQNYPYTSESATERSAAIERLVAAREGLSDTIASSATPLDENDRWWVWKCPTPGCPGLLHAAGYARDSHAVFVVCDGTCAKTFLR